MNKFTFTTFMVVLLLVTGCSVPDHFSFDREIGKSGSGRGEFLNGCDLGVTTDGMIVIADAGNNRYQVIDPKDGSVKLKAGEFGTTGFKLASIAGLGVNPLNDQVWVCDVKGNKIVRFDKTGDPMLKVTEKMRNPVDVAVDRKGNIYVIMVRVPQVNKFDSWGKHVASLGGTGKTALVHPTCIVYHDEHLYVADYGGRRIIKMTLAGEFVQEYTSKGEFEEMKGPSCLHIDKSNNLYVLDLGEVPIVQLDEKGQLISKIGTFGSERGQFLYPRGIVALNDGQIFVLDNSRNVILSFKKSQ